MSYYLLESKIDKSADSFPVLEFDFDNNKQYFSPKEGFKFPSLSSNSFNPNEQFLPAYQLVKNAQLVDNFSGSVLPKGRGLFISKKFKSLIENLKTPPVKFHPLPLTNAAGKSIENYFFMQMIQTTTSTNYAKSTFDIYRLMKKVEEVKIESENRYLESFEQLYKKERKRIKPETIQLADYYIKSEFDLFFNLHFASHFIISQKCKTLLEAENISGIEIKTTDKIKA